MSRLVTLPRWRLPADPAPRYVFVGYVGMIQTIEKGGVTPTVRASGTEGTIPDIRWDGTYFHAMGQPVGVTDYLRSTDGITWEKTELPRTNGVNNSVGAVAIDGRGTVVLVATVNNTSIHRIHISDDSGDTWRAFQLNGFPSGGRSPQKAFIHGRELTVFADNALKYVMNLDSGLLIHEGETLEATTGVTSVRGGEIRAVTNVAGTMYFHKFPLSVDSQQELFQLGGGERRIIKNHQDDNIYWEFNRTQGQIVGRTTDNESPKTERDAPPAAANKPKDLLFIEGNTMLLAEATNIDTPDHSAMYISTDNGVTWSDKIIADGGYGANKFENFYSAAG